jgi:hypothetical protein
MRRPVSSKSSSSSSQAATKERVVTKLYQDPKKRFSVRYPWRWSAKEGVVITPNYTANGIAFLAPPERTALLEAKVHIGIVGKCPQQKLAHPLTIGNLTFQRSTWSNTTEDMIYEGSTATMQSDKNCYVITTSIESCKDHCPAGHAGALEKSSIYQAFDTIVQSLRLP